jgi:hypothetical protein
MVFNPTPIELLGTLCFGSAIIHTFLVKYFQHWAGKFKSGSVGENLLHLLGEIEVVFGLWGAVFLCAFGLLKGVGEPVHYMESRNFTEPLFVFVIMVVCSTKPILDMASLIIKGFARIIPASPRLAYFFSLMILGPLLGSLITEPAAMTVTALILAREFFSQKVSTAFKYATLGLLFVSISIGGTLTHFAAPPVLMVASTWNWDSAYMLTHFGWKSALAILVSTLMVGWRFKKELIQIKAPAQKKSAQTTPAWVIATHLFFLLMIIINAHHPVVFIGIFLFFLGLVAVTQEFHDELMLRSGLLVAFFLGGLVIFGELQRWWLEPVLTQLNAATLYVSI